MAVSRFRPIDAAPRVERVEAPAAAAVRRALHESGRLTPDGERCPACQSTVHGRFCNTCGERALHRQPRTPWGFLKRGAARLLDADNRLLRSLYLLLFRPGSLTNRFLDGHRSHYVGPLQLFAIVNVAFVLFVRVTGGPTTFRNGLYYHLTADYPHEAVAQRWVSDYIDASEGWTIESARQLEDSLEVDTPQVDTSAAATAPEKAPRPALEALSRYRDYAERFDRQASQLSETLVFLFIPALAGLFWGGAAIAGTLTGRRRLASIVQATHFMTVFLVLIPLARTLVVGINALLQGLGASETGASDRTLLLLVFVFVSATVYLSLSIRRVEQSSWRRSIAQSVVIVLSCIFMQRIYTAILFFVTYVLTL
jgi:hypothetical protein